MANNSSERFSLFGICEIPLNVVGLNKRGLEGGNHSDIRVEAKLENEDSGWINVVRLPKGTFLKLGEQCEAELTPLTPSFIDRYGYQNDRLMLTHGSYLVGFFYIDRIGLASPYPDVQTYKKSK